MSINELEAKARELRQLLALIDEAQAEADALKDAIKAAMGTVRPSRPGSTVSPGSLLPPLESTPPPYGRPCRMWRSA